MSLGLTWSPSKIGSHLEPFQDSFIYSTRIYWVSTNGSGTVLGIGGTVMSKMNEADEVLAPVESMCLSPITHSHMVTNPYQATAFQLAWSFPSCSLLTSASLQSGIFIALEYLGPINE